MWRGRGATLPPSALTPSPSQRSLFYGKASSVQSQRRSNAPLSAAPNTELFTLSPSLPLPPGKACVQWQGGRERGSVGRYLRSGGERYSGATTHAEGAQGTFCTGGGSLHGVRWGRGAPVPPYAQTPSPSLSSFCCDRAVVALLGLLKSRAGIETARLFACAQHRL